MANMKHSSWTENKVTDCDFNTLTHCPAQVCHFTTISF